MLKEIIAPVYDYGNTGYGHEDIRNIKIINRSRNRNTELWLPSDKAGITLGRIVILKDDVYNQLMDPTKILN